MFASRAFCIMLRRLARHFLLSTTKVGVEIVEDGAADDDVDVVMLVIVGDKGIEEGVWFPV
jgi:hypothetical protein